MKALILALLATFPTIVHAAPNQPIKAFCIVSEFKPDASQPNGKLSKFQEFSFTWTEDSYGDFKDITSTLFPGIELNLSLGSGAIDKQGGFVGVVLFEDHVTGSSGADTFHLNYVKNAEGRSVPASSWMSSYNRKDENGELMGLVLSCDINQPFRE